MPYTTLAEVARVLQNVCVRVSPRICGLPPWSLVAWERSLGKSTSADGAALSCSRVCAVFLGKSPAPLMRMQPLFAALSNNTSGIVGYSQGQVGGLAQYSCKGLQGEEPGWSVLLPRMSCCLAK